MALQTQTLRPKTNIIMRPLDPGKPPTSNRIAATTVHRKDDATANQKRKASGKKRCPIAHAPDGKTEPHTIMAKL
jgi:hypothetical protein